MSCPENHLLILVYGISASGKSTFAEALKIRLEKSSGCPAFIFERDRIRKHLNPKMGSWKDWDFSNYQNEREVTHIQKYDILMTKLRNPNGCSYIVSDTNVSLSDRNNWKKFAEENGFSIIAHRMPTSLEDCLIRNKGREFEVDEDVIVGQHHRLIKNLNNFGE